MGPDSNVEGRVTRTIWPTRREDGSTSVAVRLPRTEVSKGRLEEFVIAWISRVTKEHALGLSEALTGPPRMMHRDPTTVDVVFDGRAGSPRWKDWLVLFTRDLETSGLDIRVEGFLDLIGGTMRHRSAP
jgi:hypothetical protein